MSILNVQKPIWNPNTRQWEIAYTVNDATIGEYQQCITCEALVSAERMIKLIREKIK